MTKITCFSDIHGMQSAELNYWFDNNPGDILLYAGDIQYNNFDNGFYTMEWINSQPYTTKVMIFGNHDNNSEGMIEYAMHMKNFYVLNDNSIIVDGIKIYGSPYSVTFGNWNFMESEKELISRYKKIPIDTNILLTHTPVSGIMDMSVRYNDIHAGSVSLKNRINKLKQLKYHVCGHIHEGYGIKKVGKVTYINASIVDEKYRFVNNPISFEYGD